MGIRFVVMSGEAYGDFSTTGQGNKELPKVRQVTWQVGRSGLLSASKLKTRKIAQHIADQVLGTEGPLHIEEVHLD